MIQSIERAVAVLEVIAREGGAASLKYVAERTGLGKTTAHNILKTLDGLGYVRRRAGDTRYHLGDRILNLARIAGDDSALRTRLRPALEAIARKSGETVYLAIPSGDLLSRHDRVRPDAAHHLPVERLVLGELLEQDHR